MTHTDTDRQTDSRKTSPNPHLSIAEKKNRQTVTERHTFKTYLSDAGKKDRQTKQTATETDKPLIPTLKALCRRRENRQTDRQDSQPPIQLPKDIQPAR